MRIFLRLYFIFTSVALISYILQDDFSWFSKIFAISQPFFCSFSLTHTHTFCVIISFRNGQAKIRIFQLKEKSLKSFQAKVETVALK